MRNYYILLMEKDSLLGEDAIINYLYLFSFFRQYIKNSTKILLDASGKNNSLNNLKNIIQTKNKTNDFNFFRSESALSWSKDSNHEVREKAKNIIFDKINIELNINLRKNYDEEMVLHIMNEEILKLKDIFNDPKLIEIFAEKIYYYMIESNKLFYLIYKNMKNKCQKKIEESEINLLKENKDLEQKIADVNEKNLFLQKEMNFLKDIIKQNHCEMEKMTVRFEETLRNNNNDMEEKLRKSNKNQLEMEEKLRQSNNAQLKMEEKLRQESENRLVLEKKIKQADKNQLEMEKKIKDIQKQNQQIIQENQIREKTANEKIKKLENEVEEISKKCENNNNYFIFRYRELLDINLKYLKRDNEINQLFQSYSEKIVNLTHENNMLKEIIEKQNIEIDKKNIEIDGLRTYIETTEFDIMSYYY